MHVLWLKLPLKLFIYVFIYFKAKWVEKQKEIFCLPLDFENSPQQTVLLQTEVRSEGLNQCLFPMSDRDSSTRAITCNLPICT